MPKALMVVLTNPTSPDTAEEFATWYNGKHLPDIAAMPGVVSATRYRVVQTVPVMPGLPGDSRQSLAVYELEAETEADLARVTEVMGECMQAGTVDLSPTLDMATAAAYFALPISERVVAA